MLAAWAGLALLLVLGVPLFVCMPLETDVIHYDICARNLRDGGVAYRDVLDNNLPGIVWIQLGLRTLLGWSSEALRLADLAFVAAIVGMLAGQWAAPPGRARARRIWAALALFAFYFSTSEWCHCQRDTWMLLPALAALGLRARQTAFLQNGGRTGWVMLRAAGEGLCWAAAVWIKPFVMIPALACWLTSAALVWRASGRRFLLADAAGLIVGGLGGGLAGVAWLVESGAWHDFVEVLSDWNRDYYSGRNLWQNLLGFGFRFPAWSLLNLAAVPVAVTALVRVWLVPPAAPSIRLPWPHRQALLAAFYLGWATQVVVWQRQWEYVHVPVVLLAVALLAGWEPRHLRPLAVVALMALAAFALVWHPLLRPSRVAAWPRCFLKGSTPEMRDRLALTPRVDWVELQKVKRFLEEQGVADGELTCYDARTLSLYLELGVRPSTRFVYLDNFVLFYPRQRELIRSELAHSGQRYLVNDLYVAGWKRELADLPEWKAEHCLPKAVPDDLRQLYPWTEPVVFQKGRYVVHEVKGRPVGTFWQEHHAPE